MATLMEQAIDALRHVPTDQQDEIARVVLRVAGIDQPVYRLTPEERADIKIAKAEIERGDVVTEEHLRSIWAKHGL